MTNCAMASSFRRITGVFVLSLAVFAVVSPPAFAQSQNTANTLKLDEPAERLDATVGDLAWLAGYWRGESSLGMAEEIWMPPSDGTMVGAFKVVRDNQPYFYEFVEISQQDGRLAMRVKHFNPDLHGWEDKDDFVSFPLVKLGAQVAYFSGLTYKLTSPTTLQVYVTVKQEDGQFEEIEFTYDRQAAHDKD